MVSRAVLALAVVLVVGAASGGVLLVNPTAVGGLDATALGDLAAGDGPAGVGGSAEPAPDNPWRADPVVVAVEAPADANRSYAPLVREALDYWATEGTRYRTYDATFVLRPNATDPDVRVRFVADIPDCAGGDRAIGCAPRLGPDVRVEGPSVVRIETGWTDRTTVDALKHEFGHLLGVDHGAGPAFMAATNEDAEHLPVPNATDRAFPWRNRTLAVHVAADPANVSAARNATLEATAYYASGADGWAEVRPRFVLVEDPAAADVVVRYANGSACPGGRPLCWRVRGVQADSDAAPEYFRRVNATVAGVDPARSEWYVGYALGIALGAEGREELPAPFRNPDGADERWFD